MKIGIVARTNPRSRMALLVAGAALTFACTPNSGIKVFWTVTGEQTQAMCARFGVKQWRVRTTGDDDAEVVVPCGARWSTASRSDTRVKESDKALARLGTGDYVVTLEALGTGGRVLATKTRAVEVSGGIAVDFALSARAFAGGTRGDLVVTWRLDGRGVDHGHCSPSLSSFQIDVSGADGVTVSVPCTAGSWSSKEALFDLREGSYRVSVAGSNGSLATSKTRTVQVTKDLTRVEIDLTTKP